MTETRPELPKGNSVVTVLAWAYASTGDADFEWARMEVTSVFQPWRKNSNTPERLEAAIASARALLKQARKVRDA